MFMKNFCGSFGNTATFVLNTIGIVAGGVSFLPIPMPCWVNITLKAVAIAAPIAGAIVGTVKFFKNRKKNNAPETMTEMAIAKNDTLSEDELYDGIDPDLLDDYEESKDVVSNDIRRNKVNLKKDCDKGNKKKGSENSKNASKIVNELYKYSGCGGTCEDVFLGKNIDVDYPKYVERRKQWNDLRESINKAKAMPSY